MARIKNDIFSGFSGKLGNVVGCKGKNGNYLRMRPEKYRDAKTNGQVQQRSRFTLANTLLKSFTPLIRIGYKDCGEKRTAFTAAMSFVMNNAILQGEEGYYIDYRKVKMAQGTLTTLADAKVEFDNREVKFLWTDNSGQGDANSEDSVMVLVYNKTKGMALYETDKNHRCDQELVLALPDDWDTDEMAIYLAIRNEEKQTVSNSECLWDSPVKR